MHWRRGGSADTSPPLTNGVWKNFTQSSRSGSTLILYLLVIEEANWLTLPEDLKAHDSVAMSANGFDAIICLGNSFAHLLDLDGVFSLNPDPQEVGGLNF